MFSGKKITLCLSGRGFFDMTPEIVSWLRGNRAAVQIGLNGAVTNYLASRDLEGLSGNPVASDMFTLDDAWRAVHIDIAVCDLFILAFSDRSIIEKAAIGMADDLITAALLATSAPVLIIPAFHIDNAIDLDFKDSIGVLSDLGYLYYFLDYGGDEDKEKSFSALKARITAMLVNQ